MSKNGSNKESSIIRIGENILMCLIILYGVFFRTIEYLANRSLWLDEAMLAESIPLPFWDIILKPLANFQAAPIGFMVVTKYFTVLFGNNEYILRFLPFVAGQIAILLFCILLVRVLNKRGAFIALFLFCTSTMLIRYDTEFKQYSVDVAVALIFFLYGIYLIEGKINLKKAVYLGFIGGIAVWFSFPSVFVFGGIGLTLAYYLVSEKRWKEIQYLCISMVIFCISFVGMYLLTLQEVVHSSGLERYWADAFLPIPPYNMSDQYWFFQTLLTTFSFPGMISQALLASIACMIGCFVLFKRNKNLFLIFLIPLILTLCASAVHKYPFKGRLILFYIPILYLFVAQGIVYLIGKKSYFSKAIGVIFLFSILWAPMGNAYDQISGRIFHNKEMKPYQKEEIKPILQFVSDHKLKKDKIYLYHETHPAFNYYAEKYNLSKEESIYGVYAKSDEWQIYYKELSQLVGKGRVWFIFSHVSENDGKTEEDFMVEFLEQIGVRLEYVSEKGASVYLYRL